MPNGVDSRAAAGAAATLVGTLSAHEPVKGLDVFLAAVPLVLARAARRRASSSTGPARWRRSCARWRAGCRSSSPATSRPPQALRSLAVLALPSRMETSGIALLEAMAAGIPAVATRVGGIEETGPPGAATLRRARTTRPRSPAAILALLDDPARRRSASAARRRRELHRRAAPPSGCSSVYGALRRTLTRVPRGALARERLAAPAAEIAAWAASLSLTVTRAAGGGRGRAWLADDGRAAAAAARCRCRSCGARAGDLDARGAPAAACAASVVVPTGGVPPVPVPGPSWPPGPSAPCPGLLRPPGPSSRPGLRLLVPSSPPGPVFAAWAFFTGSAGPSVARLGGKGAPPPALASTSALRAGSVAPVALVSPEPV